MRDNPIIENIVSTVGFLLLQFTIFRNLWLFDSAMAFVYLGPLLYFNLQASRFTLLTYGFVLGLLFDIFFNKMGIGIATTVLIAFLRPIFINLLEPKDSFEKGNQIELRDVGFRWFSLYSLILIVIHHLTFFVLEYFGSISSWETLRKALYSAVFTYLILLTVQLFMNTKVRRIR